MTKKYLLPCSCGNSVPIEISQAGQSVSCTCGKKHQVPSMLKIKELPEAPDPVTRGVKGETGALRRAYLYFGAILFVPSAIFLIWSLASYPKPRDVSMMQTEYKFGQTTVFQDSTPITQFEHQVLWMTDQHIDQMMPMDLYFLFLSFEQGPTFSYNFQEKYQSLIDAYRIRVTVASVLVGLAVLSIIVSFFLPKRNVEVVGWSGSEWR